MAITLERARQLRAMIEAAAGNLTDADASTAAELFPRLKQDGSLVSAGTRINWNGKVKRAAVDLWDRAENDPDNAPTLWEDLAYRDGIRIIPETITAGRLRRTSSAGGAIRCTSRFLTQMCGRLSRTRPAGRR